MRLSNLADYAVVLMSAAARQCGAVPLSAGMLAEQTGIPAPTAQKLVSNLARAGLLVASRGSGGGVRLARPAATINIADIIEAVEGPIALTSCVDEGRHDCALEASCKVQPHWGVVNGAVRDALAGISLASLSVVPAKGAGSHVPPDTTAGGMALPPPNKPTTPPAFAGATS
ncbi:SUF system Fe-S cluster assembly regulator [Sphingopyxis sp. MWB1]|uniref:SUF system Fe-S cluster assembly regulator n=1 Tax=Sphingopyxis sp. MWB1 TaxID=1537715 RepID=UPI00051A7A0F|nr:SUF system Fe-S cluster assembly regulator [Sphingopyxis sp. MWB1]